MILTSLCRCGTKDGSHVQPPAWTTGRNQSPERQCSQVGERKRRERPMATYLEIPPITLLAEDREGTPAGVYVALG